MCIRDSPKCTGLGTFKKIDPKLVIPNKNLSIMQGAIKASGWSVGDSSTIAMMYYKALAKKYDFSLDTPVKNLDKKIVNILLYGTDGEKLQVTRAVSYTHLDVYKRQRRTCTPNPKTTS